MVEVQEHALTALLLPPVGGHHVRHTPPKFPGSRDHGVTDVQELMRRLDWGVDVQPLLPDVLMKALSRYGVVEVRAGLRVKIGAQLIRIVRVFRARKPWMESPVFICAAQTAAAGSSRTI